MSAFEHVTTLLSFVYALALTHLLARIGELVVVRERVRFSGLLALWMVNAVVVVFSNWLSLWDMRSVTTWDIASIAIQFLFAVGVYALCVLVGPKAPEEGTIDLDEFFWRQRSYIYGTTLVMLVVALLANLDFLKSSNPTLFIKENITTFVMLLPAVAGLILRNRIAQWAAGLTLLAMLLVYTVLFSSALK